ncbi:MAG: STAS domain-containing protein [Prolixibacteraceae bacterium]|jgi:anti-anti-sigma regulatory factor
MKNLKFQKLLNDQKFISGIHVEGYLTFGNAQQFKNELIDAGNNPNEQLQITFSGIEDIDLSCLQLIVAFLKLMETQQISCRLNWNIDKEQLLFLESVGLSEELLMNDSYV